MSTGEMTKPLDPSQSRDPSPSDDRPPQFSTLSVHGGEARQKPGDSITDPVFCASTYTFPDTQSVINYIEEQQPREEYGRYGNPGERVAERKLAALEGGESAVLFSSGMAAIVGLLMAKLNAGDEVIFFDECYHTRQWRPPFRPRRGSSSASRPLIRTSASSIWIDSHKLVATMASRHSSMRHSQRLIICGRSRPESTMCCIP
jgi:hypothetical protein